MKSPQPSPRPFHPPHASKLDHVFVGTFLHPREDRQQEGKVWGHWFNIEGMLVNNQGQGADPKSHHLN
jgi:hypothetical protein